MTTWSKAQVSRLLIAALVGSNPAESMDVHKFAVCSVGSGLYDGLITSSVESYQVCVCVCVCVRARLNVYDL
jgi:hypothetical protein